MTDYEKMLSCLDESASRNDRHWDVVKSEMECMGQGWFKTANAWRKIWSKHCKGKNVLKTTTGESYPCTIQMKADGSYESDRKVRATEEQLLDRRAVLLLHNYDPAKWELVSAKHTQWNVNKGAGEVDTFYSSKIVVKPRVAVGAENIAEILANVEIRNPSPAFLFKKAPTCKGRMLELTLCDLHLNLLAWHGTTGQDYDLHIACDRVRDVLHDTVTRIGDERFERIVIPVGSDLFNSDGSDGATTKGTPQDEDSRFGKCFKYGLELFIEIIETLRPYADEVSVILVPGNHDFDTSMMLSHALWAYFRNCEDVVVDTVQMKRKYLEFGNVMLSLGHYDEDGKNPDRLLAAEAPEIWGRTKFREAHGAHLHQEMVVELGKVKFRRAPSVVVPSEWVYGKGYGCLQEHICYVYDPELGLRDTWHHTV